MLPCPKSFLSSFPWEERIQAGESGDYEDIWKKMKKMGWN